MCACIHTHTMEHHSTIKEDGILPFAAMWTDLENIMPSEIKSDREGQILYGITSVWNLKTSTNELHIAKQTR